MTDPMTAVPTWLLAAAGYRRNGWTNTLPLPTGEKFPPPGGFTGYDGAEVTDLDLAGWVGDPRLGNLALRLPAGVIGIDVDGYGDKDGRATIARREREWGALPYTWRITSRWPDDDVSGIRLFRIPTGLSWNNPGPGVESIARGWRYAVCWPSRHPNGRLYCAINERTGEVVADVLPVTPDELPELPQGWVDGLSNGPAVERVRGDAGELPSEWATTGTCLRVTKQVANALATLEDPAAAESRHDVTTRVVLAIVGYGARGHGGVSTALSVLHDRFVGAISQTRRGAEGEWTRILHSAVGLVAVEDREAEHCHGAECEPGKIRELPDDLVALAGASSSGSLALPAPVGGEAPVGGQGIDQDALDAILAVQVPLRFPIIDWRALWDDESEEEWIIEPLLPARRLVALYSAPKVGKSLLLLELAAGIACGHREVFGTMLGRPRTVLYVDFENDPKADIRERLQNMQYEPEDLDLLKYLSFPVLKALDSEAGSLELLAAVRHYGAEVVVIDTVSRAVEGEENVNDTWLNFYRHTGLKLKQAGVALIRLDHAGKDESKGQRGGSAKVGDVDAVWRMSRVKDGVTYRLDCEAHRFPVTETALTFHRETVPLRHRVDARGAYAAHVVEFEQYEAILRDNGLLESPNSKEAYARLKELKEAGKITATVPHNKIDKVRKAWRERTGRFQFDPSEGDS